MANRSNGPTQLVVEAEAMAAILIDFAFGSSADDERLVVSRWLAGWLDGWPVGRAQSPNDRPTDPPKERTNERTNQPARPPAEQLLGKQKLNSEILDIIDSIHHGSERASERPLRAGTTRAPSATRVLRRRRRRLPPPGAACYHGSINRGYRRMPFSYLS